MRKRREDKTKPLDLQATRSEAEIETLLDDIDRIVLSGDVGGLDAMTSRLWKYRRQLPEILTQRVIQGRARIPALAFEMLGGFAGPKASSYLRRIADERSLHDIVRFGAHRRLGWPEEKGEAKRRLAFLATMRDPDVTLGMATDEATQAWPPGVDILEEVLGYLEALPTDRRQRVIALVGDKLGTRSCLLLQAVLHIDDPETQRLTLGELVRLRESVAAGAIERLARTARDPAIRAEALAAIQRLRIRPVDYHKPEQPRPLPPVEKVLMSMIDGDGGQAIIVVRRSGEGAYMLADVFHNDHWGIKSAFGTTRGTQDRVEDIVSGLQDVGIAQVKADLPAARGVLAVAVEVNRLSGHPIPPVYELWEPLLHDVYPPPAEEPATVPELDDAAYTGRNDLVLLSAKLADHEFFTTWPFHPMRTLAAMAIAPAPSAGRLTNRHYRPLIEHLVDAEVCAALCHRLRRQAWLLDRAGDVTARDLALAVAAQLGGCSGDELAKQPFLRTLVQRSVDRALVSFPFELR